MGTSNTSTEAPDLAHGVPATLIEEGIPFGAQIGGEAVVLVRRGAEIFAIGGTCTHYSAPLADGIVVDDQLRCPWHHACFSVRSGAVLGGPAMNPLPRWDVVEKQGRIFVGKKYERDALAARKTVDTALRNVVIVGGGAAGTVAAEELRREGFNGDIMIIDPDADAPYDRPNLSKDYLAGSAPEEWLPLRAPGFHAEHDIQRTVEAATSIDTQNKLVTVASGQTFSYDALILATGATPVRIPVPGIELPHVRVLRTLHDCRALIDALQSARSVVIVGASFIGMEAAAALRARNIDVTVVAPEQIPFAKVLGAEIGSALKQVHEQHGVQFRLGRSLRAISETAVSLDDGTELAADVVLLGIGVRPQLDLARTGGLQVDNGVLVNEYLESSVSDIYAVGDIARFPSPYTGNRVRIEHWVVAQRQGATAARNILGAREAFTDVPFFWTQQFDKTIAYVGHAEDWTDARLDGSPEAGDCAVSFMKGEQQLAYATIGRDRDSLNAERNLELGLQQRQP
jgi:3-phenylpropionate/trans-cinnamate dioxygenase ferredoxin reductase subunit